MISMYVLMAIIIVMRITVMMKWIEDDDCSVHDYDVIDSINKNNNLIFNKNNNNRLYIYNMYAGRCNNSLSAAVKTGPGHPNSSIFVLSIVE